MKLSNATARHIRTTAAQADSEQDGAVTNSSNATPTTASEARAVDNFEASDSLRANAAKLGGGFTPRVSTRVGELQSSVGDREGTASSRFGSRSGKDAVSLSRNEMLMSREDDMVEGAANMVTGGAAIAGVAGAAKGYSLLKVGVVVGGATGTVAALGATAFGAGMVFGIGFNKLWQGFTGKAPGVSLYDWLHPEENQPAEMPESPASGATGTDGSIGAGDSAGTGGTDEASGAKGDDGVAESDEEGEGETSTTGDSDAASAAEASGSNSAETDNDNDGDGRPDDDGTTPIHEENGSYVPLVGVTGGRLGREQAQRDGDAIDVARGADVTNPLDGDAESGGGGGGVTGDATGGGHDAPSRIAPAGLETQSVRHVGFRLAGGGTLDPVALAVLAGIRG